MRIPKKKNAKIIQKSQQEMGANLKESAYLLYPNRVELVKIVIKCNVVYLFFAYFC